MLMWSNCQFWITACENLKKVWVCRQHVPIDGLAPLGAMTSAATLITKLGPIFVQDQYLNTLRPRQNGFHFTDDSFKCIFLNENIQISIKISLKYVPKSPINNIPTLVQIMAWHWPGDKPLSEPMVVSLLTDICFLGLNDLNVNKESNQEKLSDPLTEYICLCLYVYI